MDETEIEAQSPPSGALPSVAGGPNAFLSRFDALNAAAQQAATAEKETRRQMFEQAEQRLQAPHRLRFGSPEVTQTLFGLANALVSPRPYGGFAGTMANVMPVLSQSAQSMSDAQKQREAALQQLREQYQLGTATAATTAAERELSNLGTLARFYEPQAAAEGLRYDPNATTGGYTVRPGQGGMPAMNSRGQYVVNNPAELAVLTRLAPDAIFVAEDNIPRYVTPR